jgi:mRNA-degrading endonuclease toxin of MazEF toxin-antitoxin module
LAIKRGEIWWASLPVPTGSGPGLRRPVLVVQSNPFNASRISTALSRSSRLIVRSVSRDLFSENETAELEIRSVLLQG